jgi:hypothetical protein
MNIYFGRTVKLSAHQCYQELTDIAMQGDAAPSQYIEHLQPGYY